MYLIFRCSRVPSGCGITEQNLFQVMYAVLTTMYASHVWKQHYSGKADSLDSCNLNRADGAGHDEKRPLWDKCAIGVVIEKIVRKHCLMV